MKIIFSLVFVSLLLLASSVPIPENEEQEQQQTQQKKKIVTKDVMKSSFEKGFVSNSNRTYDEPDFTATIRVQEEGIDVVVDFYKKRVYFGSKVDLDFKSTGTDTNFVFDALISSCNPEQELSFDVKGTMNGKSVNEKGQIILKWDMIKLLIKAGITEETDGYQDMVAAITECLNPVTKTEGIPEDLAAKVEDAIYNTVMERWENSFKMELGKETKHGKSYNACRKVKQVAQKA